MARRSGNTDKANHATFIANCDQTWIVNREFNGCWIGARRNDKFRISDVLHVPAGDKAPVGAQILICHSEKHLRIWMHNILLA